MRLLNTGSVWLCYETIGRIRPRHLNRNHCLSRTHPRSLPGRPNLVQGHQGCHGGTRSPATATILGPGATTSGCRGSEAIRGSGSEEGRPGILDVSVSLRAYSRQPRVVYGQGLGECPGLVELCSHATSLVRRIGIVPTAARNKCQSGIAGFGR